MDPTFLWLQILNHVMWRGKQRADRTKEDIFSAIDAMAPSPQSFESRDVNSPRKNESSWGDQSSYGKKLSWNDAMDDDLPSTRLESHLRQFLIQEFDYVAQLLCETRAIDTMVFYKLSENRCHKWLQLKLQSLMEGLELHPIQSKGSKISKESQQVSALQLLQDLVPQEVLQPFVQSLSLESILYPKAVQSSTSVPSNIIPDRDLFDDMDDVVSKPPKKVSKPRVKKPHQVSNNKSLLSFFSPKKK